MSFDPNEHLMPLKGKDYLQVMWRLVWFREEHPDWTIQTDLVEHVFGDHAVFKAAIVKNGGGCISTAYGSESIKDFKDYLEKAETKAVGRALAMCGYGTQFAPEIAEGDDEENQRLADSPVQKKSDPQQTPQGTFKYVCEHCGKVIAPYAGADGKMISLRKHVDGSKTRFGRVLCIDCIRLNADN